MSIGKRWGEMSIGRGRGGVVAEEVSIGQGADAAVGGGGGNEQGKWVQ